MDPLIGQLIGNRYAIQSLLGKQRGRRTFLAEDSQTQQPVVIKLILFGPDFTWEDLKLFEREAETLKSLQHPAIPEYLDSFEVEIPIGRGFVLVQTYIDARSLQDWVTAGRTFNEGELRAIATQLLNILSYLHNRNPPLIHRDIKPSNILLSDSASPTPNKIYLVDFGSVQTIQHTGTMTVVGTYGYMPPEQFGGRAQPASDLYSLGATLIYLATGQHPADLAHNNFQIEFADISNLTPAFYQWIKQLTQADLSKRIVSVAQAKQQLTQPSPLSNAFAPPSSAELVQPSHQRQLQATQNDIQIFSTPDELEIECSTLRTNTVSTTDIMIQGIGAFFAGTIMVCLFLMGLNLGGVGFLVMAVFLWLINKEKSRSYRPLKRDNIAHIKIINPSNSPLLLCVESSQHGRHTRHHSASMVPLEKIVFHTHQKIIIFLYRPSPNSHQTKEITITGSRQEIQWLKKNISQWHPSLNESFE